jgi:hypothetical protein
VGKHSSTSLHCIFTSIVDRAHAISSHRTRSNPTSNKQHITLAHARMHACITTYSPTATRPLSRLYRNQIYTISLPPNETGRGETNHVTQYYYLNIYLNRIGWDRIGKNRAGQDNLKETNVMMFIFYLCTKIFVPWARFPFTRPKASFKAMYTLPP